MANPPVLLTPPPSIVTFEGSPFGPLDLKNYIKNPESSGSLRFIGEQRGGGVFPNGLICTSDGLVSGIAATGTAGTYNIDIVAQNDAETLLRVETVLIVKERLEVDTPHFLTNLKSQVWQALGTNLPIPEWSDLWNRPISAVEIYYLLQRYAVLTIWDAYNLESPSVKHELILEGANRHYHFYDRGSCLVAAPKDLYSHERGLNDALDASRILAREVYRRGWTIEFAGFQKMVRAAWVELQNLGDKSGKKLEILHFEPTSEDVRVYVAQAKTTPPTPT